MDCFNSTAASKDKKVSNHCDWLSGLCSALAAEADAVCFVSQEGHVIIEGHESVKNTLWVIRLLFKKQEGFVFLCYQKHVWKRAQRLTASSVCKLYNLALGLGFCKDWRLCVCVCYLGLSADWWSEQSVLTKRGTIQYSKKKKKKSSL